MSRRLRMVAVLAVAVMGGSCALAFGGGFPKRTVTHAPQGYLGVELRDLPEEQVSAMHLPSDQGAEIVRLDHDGPAGKAGLREHDVVLQMNGHAIAGQNDLRNMLRDTTPGTKVTLLILRDGQQQTVVAMLANREEVERLAWQQHIVVADPDGQGAPAEAVGGTQGMGFLAGGPRVSGSDKRTHRFLGTVLGAPYTGLTVEPVGPQLGEFFGVQSGVGLLVQSVDPDSPGAVSGLRAGDVVIKANENVMRTEGEWTKTLHENRGRPVPVVVLRDRKEQTVTLTPDPKRRAEMRTPRGFKTGEAGEETAILAAMDAADSRT